MSIPTLRRQPWYSSIEWMDVYNGIFTSNDFSKREAAIARISLWEMKSNRVPVAVSLTRLLLRALQVDQEGSRSTAELQMLYGAAIVRFVNSHVDINQSKPYAQSIASIARDLGIPSEVVNCRHCITHQEMPTLEMLRHTASICFDFLQTNYWEPQAEIVRSRLASITQSKYLASGLVALLQDLESLAPPEDLDSSLQQLVDEVSGSSWRRHISAKSLLFAAANVAGLKQKDAMRILKRMGMPEYFSQPALVAASGWCQQLRKTLPKCMEFLETILYQCPHENVTLSFLKDLILVAYDPEINPAALLAVVWILGRGSPNLSYRLICRVVVSLISPPPVTRFSGGHLPMGSTTGCSDFKCFSSSPGPVSTNIIGDHVDGHHPAGIISDDGVGHCCYDRESFSLWLRAMDVPFEEEEHLTNDLNHNFGYQGRLLNWLRTLLLLPSPLQTTEATNDSTTTSQLPFCLELLLHLFCDPSVQSTVVALSASQSPSSSAGHPLKLAVPANQPISFPSLSCLTTATRDLFCQRLLQCINTAHGRVLSACRSNIETIARAAFRVLFVESNSACSSIAPDVTSFTDSHSLKNSVPNVPMSDSHRGLKLLLRVFEEADVRVPYSGASRLVDWVSSRMLKKTATFDSGLSSSTANRPQRQALQRLLLPLGRSVAENGSSIHPPFLTDQFKAVLVSLLQSSAAMPHHSPVGGDHGVPATLQMTDGSDPEELLPAAQATAIHSSLASLRRRFGQTHETPAVRELSTLEIPWTHPGTFPLHQPQVGSSDEHLSGPGYKPIIELTAPVTEVLRTFTASADDIPPSQSCRKLKRCAMEFEKGEIPVMYSDDPDYHTAPRQPAKRFRSAYPEQPTSCSPISATERFIFNHSGSLTRDETPSSRAVRFVPLALQQLESEIIRQQQQQFQDSVVALPNSNNTLIQHQQTDEDRLMQDWCALGEMLHTAQQQQFRTDTGDNHQMTGEYQREL